MNTRKDQLEAFNRLLDIMDELREKCPWDRKQNNETLRTLSIEEIYELSDAIIENDSDEIKKELGDVFLHLVFYSKIASEKSQFDVADVLNSICDKLIHRHPHIYGDTKADTEEKVLQNWEKLKLKEGNKSVLSGVPTSLPAMVKAFRIQDKVKGVGFEFENTDQVFDKIQEEIIEFKNEENPIDREMEFGDILFSLINYGRFVGINSEDALEKSNKKFISRFQILEELAVEKGLIMGEMTISQLEDLWNLAKIR
ncbi:nucleoside triphosphate pyrophosphohydrolase [Faecalibacter macacae]|uniref:Nucleoside triphosphate pyrophosphohydrolase n=1 Tax=Faecalibacter macacae TaxID=1859289 RepID=A0A3L9MEF8_9FLAO|nr:nucleoside triphosphate pyrophosphohydrolase [Faecalibacter macacae]RLZ11467.1 nucleoside triphosphate pyrophosphohydrolase [Faecalibacter macacae]